MNDILDKIVTAKRQEVAQRIEHTPMRKLEQWLAQAPPVRAFRAALEAAPGMAIIAEVKKASPSAGVLRADFDAVAIAQIYETNGASAISVLTDDPFFQGKLRYLSAVRQGVSLPVMRKDFILDRYQILEARAAGADAVLLIAEILEGEQLSNLMRAIEALGMQALVELHDPVNVPRVLAAGARIIGVNNRDLRNFESRIENTLDIVHRLPADVCLVSESGIRSRADVERLQAAGVRAVLVGEALMRASDIGAKLRELQGGPP